MLKKISILLLISTLLFSMGILPSKFSNTANAQIENEPIVIEDRSGPRKPSLQNTGFGIGGGSMSSSTYMKAAKALTIKIVEKSLGKGSTGRQVPKDLVEEMFMDTVLDNPLSGAEELKNIKLNDSRWHHSDGWVKMERKLKTNEGRNVVVHFVYNKITKQFDDFKFK